MRTSLRDPDNTNTKRIVTPDRRGAEFLLEKLPGATVHKLDSGIIEITRKVGRPRTHIDDVEKSRRRRQRDKENRRTMLLEMLALPVSQDHSGVAGVVGSNLRIETPIDIRGHFDTQLPYTATIFTHKKSTQPWYLYCQNWEAFVNLMKQAPQVKWPSKESNGLISSATFDPALVVFDAVGKKLRRGRGSIVYLQKIMLDFEKGEITPEQFADLFPEVEMVMTNTWGHTKEKPRFRVIIPTTRQMTQDVYESIFDEIVQRMEDEGIVKNPRSGSNHRKSGLDHSKRSATSLFFLPCQAEIADESFFDVYAGSSRQPLNPEVWMQTARFIPKDEFEFVTIQPHQGEYDQTRLDAAISRWRHETPPKEANHLFYLFALELKKIGMADQEIETTLKEEALHGRSPAKRLAQIPSIMASLAKGKSKTPAHD